MSLTDGKHIRVKGSPTSYGQQVENSNLNEEKKSFGQYKQVSNQPIAEDTVVTITCNGADGNNFGPTENAEIWDTNTSTASFEVGGFYMFDIEFGILATLNRTNLQVRLISASDGTTVYYKKNIEALGSGDVEIISAVFNFYALMTDTVELQVYADKDITIGDVTVVTKREY